MLDVPAIPESDVTNFVQSVKEKVVIIIPTYNEAMGIRATILQVFAAVQKIEAYEICVLVFDSASTDGTALVVQALQEDYPRLYVLSEDKKSGLGSAYLQAMKVALSSLAADIVFEFDADLSHHPSYIAPMLNALVHCD